MKRISLLLTLALLIAGCGPDGNPPEMVAPTTTSAGGTVQLSTSAPAEARPTPAEATSAPAATPAAAGDVVTITFAGLDSESSYFAPLIERFNQDNSGIQVRFVSLDEITRPAANESYDLDKEAQLIVSAADTAVFNYPRPENITKGYLLDLKPLMDADPSFDRGDFYPGAFDRFSYHGGVYIVPRFIYINLIAYNRDLWAKKGVAPPKPDWTMKDMFAAASQLATRRGNEVTVYGTIKDDPLEVLRYELVSAGL